MAHVQDVAAYILKKMGTISAMKLQKLCFFTYGYHLAWEERPLFPEHFEAWANGPVCRPLYAMHRLQFSVPGRSAGTRTHSTRASGSRSNLVLDGYGRFSAHQLSAMTHRAGPWSTPAAAPGPGPLDSGAAGLPGRRYLRVLRRADLG